MDHGCDVVVGLSAHQPPGVCLWGVLGVCQAACLVLQPQPGELGGV